MKTCPNKKQFLFCILVPLFTGLCSAIIIAPDIRSVYASLQKPPLSPPAILYPAVWTILYILMGAATYFMVTAPSNPADKQLALMIYSCQLLLNFLWPVLFFHFRIYGPAFFFLCFLWFLLFINLIVYYRISQKAGLLLLPYLVWCGFALYLNLGFALLN